MYIILIKVNTFDKIMKDSKSTQHTSKNTISRQSKTSTSKQPKKKKLTLVEKQAIKLKIQQERQAQKAAAGELVPKNKERFYCTSAELHAELVKWRDSAEKVEDRVLSEELGRMLIAIADKMLNRSEFRNYSKQLKEDAKGFFFVKAIKGLKNYNFEFNNPFAYFSTCAWNAYISVITKYYKQQNIRKEVMQQLLSELETYSGIDPRSSLNNYIRQYVDGDTYGVGASNE